MERIKRIMTISAQQHKDVLQITVSQIDVIVNPPLRYEFTITGDFDDALVLRAIRVDTMEGSKGAICAPAKETLQALVGVQVGQGFNRKVRALSGPRFCMHFPAMLQQMATTALRCKQINILQSKGKTAFLRANTVLFKDKCVGYSE
jgi:hypothetical protein